MLFVGISIQPSNLGYLLAQANAQVFSFGDATGAHQPLRLNSLAVGIAGTLSGKGHWLGASDGGVFAFGDAKFMGSVAATPLKMPIVGIASQVSSTGG